jgi:hypothetical protein
VVHHPQYSSESAPTSAFLRALILTQAFTRR